MVEEKLIEAVREYRELYDTKHPNYMKTKQKSRIWQDIAAYLNLKEGEEAKTTWLKLRNSFRDARRRQMRCIKSGAAPENIKPWRYQKQMTFLESFMSAGPREGIVNDSDEDSQHLSALPICNAILDSENVEGDNSFAAHEQPNNGDVERDKTEESTSNMTTSRNQDNVHNLLRRCLHKRDKKTKQRGEKRRKLESRHNPTDDPLYNFFISMYQLTKQMSPQYQHRVRGLVFQAVSNAEEEIMKNPSWQPSTCCSLNNNSFASSPSSDGWSDSDQTHLQHPGISALSD